MEKVKNMKIKLNLSDNHTHHRMSFLFKTTGRNIISANRYSNSRRLKDNLNNRGEFVWNISETGLRSGNVGYNYLEEILAERLQTSLLKTHSKRSPYYNQELDDGFFAKIGFKYKDGRCNLILMKDPRYSINATSVKKNDFFKIIAKVLLYSEHTRSAKKMNDYVDNLLNYPPNVLYALENRTPYHFYSEGHKVECKINTRRISKKKLALEISSNVWAEISVKDLNTFIDCFRFNKAKSKKWSLISPPKLWKQLFGEEPTSAQRQLMVEWLKQNRTENLVQERAKQLVIDLCKQNDRLYPIKLPDRHTYGLYVRGELSDWMVLKQAEYDHVNDTEDGNIFTSTKGQHQSVTVHRMLTEQEIDEHAHDFEEKYPFDEYPMDYMTASICIDTVVQGSSVGDQLASRALILLNDNTGIEYMVYTLKEHIQKATESPSYRIDESYLNGEMRWDIE